MREVVGLGRTQRLFYWYLYDLKNKTVQKALLRENRNLYLKILKESTVRVKIIYKRLNKLRILGETGEVLVVDEDIFKKALQLGRIQLDNTLVIKKRESVNVQKILALGFEMDETFEPGVYYKLVDGVCHIYIDDTVKNNDVSKKISFMRRPYIKSAKHIIVSGGSGLVSMTKMFTSVSPDILDITRMDTSNVVSMRNCFCYSESNRILVGGIDTHNVEHFDGMFSGCKNVKELDVADFDTGKAVNTTDMFLDCSKLEKLDISKWILNTVKYCKSMFKGCTSLTYLNTSNLRMESIEEMAEMFADCYSIRELDLRGLNTSKVRDMSSLFNGCSLLSKLDLSSFDTHSVRLMSSMFIYCRSLKELDLSNFDTSNVIDMSRMFGFCGNISKLDLTNFDTRNVISMARMFVECYKLKTLRFFPNSTKLTNLNWMFYSCYSLESVNLRCLVTTADTTTVEMFGECHNLREVELSNMFYISQDMFKDCYKLKYVMWKGKRRKINIERR